LNAFASAQKELNTAGLTQALKDKNHAAVLEAASKAVDTLTETLRPGLEQILYEVLKTSGEVAGKALKKRLRATRAATGFRTSVVTKWQFDITDPNAVAWIEEHAGETIEGINEDTRAQIRDLVEEAFTEQYDVNDLAAEIADVIGDDARAETIARTETMRASNQGQLEAWDQATDAGLLTGDETKEWIVTPDDRLCPICEPLEGVTAALGDDFDADGENVDAPPAHPRCRCTIALNV